MADFQVTGNEQVDFGNALAAQLGGEIATKEPQTNVVEVKQPEVKQEPIKEEPKTEPAKTPEPAKTEPLTTTEPAAPDKPVTDAPVFDFNKSLYEKSKGKIKDETELEKLLTKDYSKHPELESIFEHLEKKGTLDSYFKIKALGDPDQMKPRDTIRTLMALENPELSQAQLDRLMNKKYPSRPDDTSELDEDELDRFEDAEISAITDGKAAKERLKQYISELHTPKAFQEEQSKQAEAKAQIDNFNNSVSGAVKNIKELQFPLGDKSFTYVPSETELKDLEASAKETIKDGEFWSEAGKDENGNFNLEKMIKARFFAKNMDKILKKYADHAKALALDELKGTLKNTKDIDSGNPLVNVEDNSVDNALLRGFYGQ